MAVVGKIRWMRNGWMIPTGRCEELEQMQTLGARDGLCAAVHSQLAINTADLGLNGVGGDDQFPGNLVVGLSGNEQTQHPLLLGAQWLKQQGVFPGRRRLLCPVFLGKGVQESAYKGNQGCLS